MRSFLSSVLARPRGLVCAVTIAFAAGTAVGWTAALPGIPVSVDSAALPVKPDFDFVFASLDVAASRGDALPRGPRAAPSARAAPDDLKAAPRAKVVTPPDFDLVFASVAAPPRDVTPARREQLRNIGWKRILPAANPKPTAARVSPGRLAAN
jgi:hypothetical protein